METLVEVPIEPQLMQRSILQSTQILVQAPPEPQLIQRPTLQPIGTLVSQQAGLPVGIH